LSPFGANALSPYCEGALRGLRCRGVFLLVQDARRTSYSVATKERDFLSMLPATLRALAGESERNRQLADALGATVMPLGRYDEFARETLKVLEVERVAVTVFQGHLGSGSSAIGWKHATLTAILLGTADEIDRDLQAS